MKFLKGFIWIVIAIGLVFGAVTAVKKKREQEAKIEKAKVYKIAVNTLKLKKSRVLLTLPYLAVVESSKDAKILTKLSGRVLSIVKTGDRVKKGEVVAKIDDSELVSKLQALKLGINSLKLNIDAKKLVLKNLLLTHKRTKELLDVKGASIEQYQNEENQIALTKAGIKTLQSSIEINRAKIKELESLMSYATLKSPTDGIVSKTFITQGDVSMPGHPLLSISSSEGKYLLLNLPSSQKVKEIVFEGKRYEAKPLHSTFNALEQYRVDAKISQNSGERVNVKVIVFDKEAIKVPVSGVLQNGGKNYIFIVNADRAVQTKVNVLASGEEGLALPLKYEGKKIVLAKPDIFLKLISGLKIKEQ